MTPFTRIGTAAALLLVLDAASIAAQGRGLPAENTSPVAQAPDSPGEGTGADSAPPRRAGWSVTPAVGYGGSWDDNVLIQGSGDATRGDFVQSIDPQAQVKFGGRRSEVSGAYNGSFVRYRDLNSLNSYDQHAFVSAQRLLTKHAAIVANNTLSISPTTELSALVGVPFVRTGSRVEDLRVGVAASLSKHTSASATYNFEWIDFNADPGSGITLLGGHSHGAALSIRRSLGEHTALTADYDLQHATVAGGDGFNVHNVWTGADQRMSPTLRVFGAFGVARLEAGSAAPARTGPAWRAGFSRQMEHASVDVAYSRSFVPSYSFGGTMQNEDVTTALRLPVARRVSSQSSVAWRRNESLDGGDNLKSLLLASRIGYAVRPWVRIEAFYEGVYQSIARPGGRLNRNRVGFQLVTAQSMRVR